MKQGPVPFLVLILALLLGANFVMARVSQTPARPPLRPIPASGPLDAPITPRMDGITPRPSTVDARLQELEERVRSLEGYRGYQMRQDGSDRAARTWQAR